MPTGVPKVHLYTKPTASRLAEEPVNNDSNRTAT